MVILKEVTFDNFKSFNQRHTVKCLLPFSAIVGPNGVGKSNFTDGISFAMGVNCKVLRVSRLEELVHRKGIAGERASVKLVLEGSCGSDMCFERTISNGHCNYLINTNVVSHAEYLEALRNLNINPDINNFIVFQDSIQSIIMMNPIERTAMFENISGSDAFKNKYKELCVQRQVAEQNLQFMRHSRKSVITKMKNIKFSMTKADEYKSLQEAYDKTRTIRAIFEIHYIDRFIENATNEEQILSKNIAELEKIIHNHEKSLGRVTKRCKSLTDESVKIDRDVKGVEAKLYEHVVELAKLKGEVQYVERRLDDSRKSLESALTAHKAHNATIRELENELKIAQEQRNEFCQGYTESFGRDSQPNESQIDEYERLKEEFCQRFAKDLQQIMILERKYKSLQDNFDNENRKRDEVQSAIDRKKIFLTETTSREEKLTESIEDIKNEIKVLMQQRDELSAIVESSKEKAHELNEELEMITEQLGRTKTDEFESKKFARQQEIITDLKRFPGIYGRLGTLCTTIDSRYNIAAFRVLGKHRDSIVVDTLNTATKCTQYLRQNRLGSETFLPVDYIKVQSLKEHLRNITNPPNVKLLYDVFNFTPAEIGKALLFAIGSTLVCETLKAARAVAYEIEDGKRNDCISLDGSFFRKSGIISGGAWNLAENAKKWDAGARAEMKIRKEALITELRKTLQEVQKESDLCLISKTITCLESRLRYIRSDRDTARKELSAAEKELEDLIKQRDSDSWKKARSDMADSLKEIEHLKSRMDAEEKKMFSTFCDLAGVEDIRQYETGKKLYKEKLQNFDNLIDRITEQLNYERTRDTYSNITRWEKNVANAEEELNSVLEQEQRLQVALEEPQKILNDINLRRKAIDIDIENLTVTMKNLRSDIANMSAEHRMLAKRLSILQTSISKKKSDRHQILQDAKMHGLAITLNSSLTPSQSNGSSNTPSDDSAAIYEREMETKVDVTKLPEDLRDLEDTDEITRAGDQLKKKITELLAAINEIPDPNMKASQQLDMSQEELNELNKKIKEARRQVMNITTEFDLVKRQRYEKFMEFFEHASNGVDAIYKKLTKDNSAQAYLLPENVEEPYLGGIHYNCIAPQKRFGDTNNLSGGEKVLAVLSLLFTTQSGRGTPPFQILDEIDASLDRNNVMKVRDYIDSNKNMQQSIVISHKVEFVAGADVLIGIIPQVGSSSGESQIIKLDLRRYKSNVSTSSNNIS